MPSTIVVTPKSADANSYVTVAAADTYFGDRLNAAAWTGADADDQTRALIMAAIRLDEERFDGAATTDAQAMKWPRFGTVDKNGDSIDQDTVPELIKRAQYEIAIWMLGEDRLSDSGLEAFKDVKVGPLSVTPRHARRAGVLPQAVRRILGPVQTRVSRGTVKLERA